MENSYGISVKNKYELFWESEDPLEILREQEMKAAAKKAEKIKKATLDKDAKTATKNKQNKAIASATAPPTSAQDSKNEAVAVLTSAPGKSGEDKQKRQKASDDSESRLLKDRGNRQKPAKEEPATQDEGEKLIEIGTFEARGSSGGARERRGGRGRGGYRGNSERSPRENMEGNSGPERRPRRGNFNRGPRPNYFADRNGEGQANGNFEVTPSDVQNAGGNEFGGQFNEERRERQFINEERRGFTGRNGFGRRREDGENRGFGGYRRSYENRPPRRFFGSRQAQDVGAEAGSPEENKASGYEEPQQEVESFGHWGAENTGTEEAAHGNRGRGRGFGRRGRGRGRFGGRREFSRRGGGNEGGLGVKAVEKRDGTGSHNWGTVMDDLEAQNEVTTVTGASWADQAEAAENQENAGNISASYEDESGAASASAPPAEPEVKMMTLDEYKAVMEAKRIKMEHNIRKPGEGCSDDKWKKTYVLKKKEPVKEEEEEDEDAEDERHAKPKNILPIEITFLDDRRVGSGGRGFGGKRGGRGGFDRGGYGGRRGSGPRGSGERRPPRERAPNVADEHDFPSLVPAGAAQ